MDINKKIEGIMQSHTLDDLSLKFLPPVSSTPDNYYFISYSHKDYKQVYADIYALQSEGVNVWYDRAMPAGENWKETAEKYIRPSRCAGVVFYVSENSLLSPAIHEEIAFAKQCGKSCLTINLPTSDGKSHSAKEMLDAMQASGVDIPSDKYDFIAQSFNEEILYLPYSQSAEQKADKIVKLKKPDLFEFEVKADGVVLTAVKDIEIRNITADQIVYIDKNTKKQRAVETIGKCAFANCTALESIELPNTVHKIQNNAFYGCRSLQRIDLSFVIDIGEYAFSDCINIQSVELPTIDSLGKEYDRWYVENFGARINASAFYGCTALSQINLTSAVKSVDKFAFAHCGCKKVFIDKNVERIDSEAFSYCRNLREIRVELGNGNYYSKDNCLIEKESNRLVLGCGTSVIPCDATIGAHSFEGSGITSVSIPNGVELIEEGAFNDCRDLKKVSIGKDLKRIQSGAFSGCESLQGVYIDSLSQWCNMIFDVEHIDYDVVNASADLYTSNPLMFANNLYLNGELVVRLIIPSDITAIRAGTFVNGMSINVLALPPNVTEVEEEAFEGCSRLVEIINHSNCRLPESLDYVWVENQIENRQRGVGEVDNMLFYINGTQRCLVGFAELVEDVVLPACPIENKYSLHELLFYDNKVVKSLTLPNNLSIKDASLGTCVNLKTITVDARNKRYATVNGVLYSKLKDHVIFIPPDTDDNLEICYGVQKFDVDLLFSCKKIKTVILPVSLKKIDGSTVEISVIKYKGTVKQWKRIELERDFVQNNPNTIVICSDGEITLS